jgi:hypothetical protein
MQRDAKAAGHWYYQAALGGDATAQSALCDMHLTGEGVSRDLALALFWCELLIENGDTSGIWFRERVLNRISEDQRDEAWKWFRTGGPCEGMNPLKPPRGVSSANADFYKFWNTRTLENRLGTISASDLRAQSRCRRSLRVTILHRSKARCGSAVLGS